MNITGQLLIGDRDDDGMGVTFHAIDARSGESLPVAFASAGKKEIDAACRLSAEAFDTYRSTTSDARARLLERIAAGIEAIGAPLIVRAIAETGLPQGSLEGERSRTSLQLRLFASLLRSGQWQRLSQDTPLPNRKPAACPDLRQRQIALGPVAVFGASNFPLAFSVAGGDTASPLAAGCPVVVKAHPSHPGTSELVARVIREAVDACGLPGGGFSMVGGESHEVGSMLVAHPAIQAVGFTGSRTGGLALMRVAQARPQPIPVYAEMSSINPVFLLPAALEARADRIAQGFVDSLVLGSGQFCTNPGLVFGLQGDDWERFVANVADAVAPMPAGTTLNAGIHRAFQKGVDAMAAHAGVAPVAQGRPAEDNCRAARPVVHQTTAACWLATPALEDEVFGPSALLVRCESSEQMRQAAEHLSGQLTATLQIDDADQANARSLLPILERKAGRILANGFPTGVEVGFATVHGGPYPATSDSRTTSVGTCAIDRFLRPVCYQDLPAALWPEPLSDSTLAAS